MYSIILHIGETTSNLRHVILLDFFLNLIPEYIFFGLKRMFKNLQKYVATTQNHKIQESLSNLLIYGLMF